MSKLFIEQEHLDELISIFKNYCPNAAIFAYGSRVNGDAHEGSDLDLAVRFLVNEEHNINTLKEQIKTSNIPFLVDIMNIDDIPLSYKQEVIKNYIQIFPN